MATKIHFDAEPRLPAQPVTAKPRSGGSEGAPVRPDATQADLRHEHSSLSPARYPGFIRVGIALGGAAACWAIIAGLLVAVN